MEAVMTGRPPGVPPADSDIPLGQRLYDNIFLLLVAGIVVMAVSFTGWGLWELMTMPSAPLP
jgi:hypothetical protein